MKWPVIIPSTLACFGAGWWFFPLWPGPEVRPAGPDAAARQEQAVAARKVPPPGLVMAQLTAVSGSVEGPEAAVRLLRTGPAGMAFDEAEELAIRLAAGEAARAAGDSPATFLRLVAGLGDREAKAAVGAWSGHQPDAALRFLLSPEGAGFRAAGLLQPLCGRDPARVLAFLHRCPVTDVTLETCRMALQAGARNDPSTAFVLLESAPYGMQSACLDALLETLALTDPQGTFRTMSCLPPDLQPGDGPAAIYGSWARTDPAGAAGHCLGSRSFLSGGSVDRIMEEWVRLDPEAAFHWIQRTGISLAQPWTGVCLGRIAVQNRERAITLLHSLGHRAWRAGVTGPVAKHWAAGDFAGALQWAAGLAGGAARDSALLALADAAAQQPDAVQRRFIGINGTANKAGIFVLSAMDPEAALRAFAVLSPPLQQEAWGYLEPRFGPERVSGKAGFLKVMIETLQSGPAGLCGGPGGMDPVSCAASVTAEWARQDPAAAAAWAVSLPGGEARQSAVATLVSNWARHDQTGVAAWIESLPEGPVRIMAGKQLIAGMAACP